jgi:hypothetical protein
LPIDDANIRQPKTQSQVFFSRNIFLGFALKKISSWIAGASTHPGIRADHPSTHIRTRGRINLQQKKFQCNLTNKKV